MLHRTAEHGSGSPLVPFPAAPEERDIAAVRMVGFVAGPHVLEAELAGDLSRDLVAVALGGRVVEIDPSQDDVCEPHHQRKRQYLEPLGRQGAPDEFSSERV